MFVPSELLKEAIETKPVDRREIIGALEGYITADPQFKTNDFVDAVKYVLNQGISEDVLFQKYDDSEDEIIPDENKWDYDYYLHARVYLKINFCPERIKHVIKIAKKLYPEKSEPSVAKNVQDLTASPQSEKSLGGQQSPGKKSQTPSPKSITPTGQNVKIAGIVIAVVLLIIVIVFIMR